MNTIIYMGENLRAHKVQWHSREHWELIRSSIMRNYERADGYTVAEITGYCGYDNPLYFTRVFKKKCSC